MDCGCLTMLWRIWMLLVAFLRRMTVRPNVLLPMAVNGSDLKTGRKAGKQGSAETSTWKEHKAEFPQNPGLHKSKELQQNRRRFYDFSSGPLQPDSILSDTPSQQSGNEYGYGKWRKKQPETNAFVFVTPPTVTVQDFSNVPLPLSLFMTAATQDINTNSPLRPPRPPSGPVPAVIVTPCKPTPPNGWGASSVLPAVRGRSGSGRHLSPEWFVRPSSDVQEQGRKGPIHDTGDGSRGNSTTDFGSTSEPSKGFTSTIRVRNHTSPSVPDIPFKSLPAVFPSLQVQTSTSTSASPLSLSRPPSITAADVQLRHEDIILPWNIMDIADNAHPAGNLPTPPRRSNSRTASFITSTPAKMAKGIPATVASQSAEEDQDLSVISSVSQAGSSHPDPPHPDFSSSAPHIPNSQARLGDGPLPDDQLDLLPYPEVFDLDMYFYHGGAGRGSLSNPHSQSHLHSQQRLSLRVMRNAAPEDIHQMQELQSRQSESIKDFHMIPSSSPPPSGQGRSVKGEDKENQASAASGLGKKPAKGKRFGYIAEAGKVNPAPGQGHMKDIGSTFQDEHKVGSKRKGGSPRPRPRPRPLPIASRPILRQVGNTEQAASAPISPAASMMTRIPAPRINKRNISVLGGSEDVVTTDLVQEAGNVHRPRRVRAAKNLLTLQQNESTNAETEATKASYPAYIPPTSTPTSKLRVLIPSPKSISDSQSQSGSHQFKSSEKENHRSPHLQVRIPGLAERIVNRTKEKDLSPIKEAFHPPSSPVLPPSAPGSAYPSPAVELTPETGRRQHPRPRPPTLPVVIVSHHRFGSVSDYDDGSRDTGSYEENIEQCSDPASCSEGEDFRRINGRNANRRMPGHHDHAGTKGSRARNKRWGLSSHGDEESALETVSLN